MNDSIAGLKRYPDRMAKDNAETLTATILNLAKRIEALLARQKSSDSPARLLVALAGVPGSGKSTVSQALLLELAAKGIEDVVVVPMVRCYRNILAQTELTSKRMVFTTPRRFCAHSRTRKMRSRDAVLLSHSMRMRF